MLAPITIRHEFRPRRRSLATAEVADLFGLPEREPPHTICENLALDIRPGDLVLFVGPSGSGKSSLLRAAAAQLGAVDSFALPLPDVPLIDALPGSVESRLARFAACGLSEARLLLRTPAELSEGERYRFRLCAGFAHASLVIGHSSFESDTNARGSPMTNDKGRMMFLAADEFTATLDRTLAKVVAFNVRKLMSRTGVGLFAATTHDDIIDDLDPDVLVRCGEEGVEVERREPNRNQISFANEMWLSEGTARDWPYFAKWHYRAHRLAFVKRVLLLWHREAPVGICVFATPAASLTLRTRYFGLVDPRSPAALAALNERLWLLQRVVLHPTYRGAGIASTFVRRACELCDVDWIETLTAMGRVNPFFERAGFTRVGVIERTGRAGQFGPRAGITAETQRKSHFSDPVYYLFDNRARTRGEGIPNVTLPPRSDA